jgi:hypothetical protein
MPMRRANLQGVSPEAFSSAKYRCRSVSVKFLRMTPRCQPATPAARWGWRSGYFVHAIKGIPDSGAAPGGFAFTLDRYRTNERYSLRLPWTIGNQRALGFVSSR